MNRNPDPRGPWLLLHGAGGGGWEWVIWQRVLRAQGIDCMAPDLMPAARGIAHTRFSDYQAQVRSLSDGAPVWVGASMGGLLLMSLAAELTPTALVLVNPVPPRGIPGAPRIEPATGEVKPWSRSPFESTVKALPDGDLASRHYAHARWRDESGAVLREMAAGIEAKPTHCRTLVMASGEDRDIAPECSRRVADALGADFLTLPGASHLGALLGGAAAGAAELALGWVRGVIP